MVLQLVHPLLVVLDPSPRQCTASESLCSKDSVFRGRFICVVLHGESITDQASPRTPTQRTFQPQEAVQHQRNQTILQADTPAQKAN